MKTETLDDDSSSRGSGGGTELPGVVVVFSGERACAAALPLDDGAVELGREALDALGLADGRASRVHARVERAGGRWTVSDLDSRNGTFVDGRRVRTARELEAPVVVRIGRTLFLPVADLRPFAAPGVAVRDGVVVGPALQAVHDRVAAIARAGRDVLLTGESGTGKELAARAYHVAGGAGERPLVAINCATIQKELAERVLFGARRGAYTGAAEDAIGVVQAADGGTLFLDEIGELDAAVQAKLLRVLETRTLTPVGAVRAVPVAVRVCAATLKNLRIEVAAGRFREDLYFRIGRPEVRLPALRERREEIPWLVEGALARAPEGQGLAPSVELIEACLLRPWPGNVRELLAEVATAAIAARARKRLRVGAEDLDDEAGLPVRTEPAPVDAAAAAPAAAAPAPEASEIEAALRAEGGNVARAAARLSISRSRLRRHLERHGIDPRTIR